MTADRRRTAVFTAYARCRGALLAALATLTLGAAPAAAEPVFSETETRNAPPGTRIYITADWTFDNAGTNPRITDAVFSTTEYYSEHGVGSGIVYLQAMTDAGLNALASPPPSPFTVDVTVTMTNDEGQTASGTVTFSTTYERAGATPLPETEAEEPPGPTLRTSLSPLRAPPGVLVSADADRVFDNTGTNPVITGAVFSTTEYYSEHSVSIGRVWAKAKTNAELNALASPPPDPFTVNVTVTMTNDEGQTAEGTLAVWTDYERDTATVLPSGPPGPTFSETETRNAPPGLRISASGDGSFDNAGTNPRITDATFSTTEYYRYHSVSNGRVWLEAKTAAELNALASPPPSPFTVDVTVTMTNDEGQTASGTIAFETTYDRIPTAPSQPNDPTVSPAYSDRGLQAAPAGTLVNVWAGTPWFNNAGTNPRITNAVFSTTEYYSLHEIRDGMVYLQAKTSAELSALASPPRSPFRVDVTVTMANDEGQTASGTIAFETAYSRVSAPTPTSSQSSTVPASGPTFSQTAAVGAHPGAAVIVSAISAFDKAGTNPRITEATFSTTEYYSDHAIRSGAVFLRVKTAAALNALSPPPPSPFQVTADVTMANDEGQTASGTITFETTYERVEPEPEPEEEEAALPSLGTLNWNAPPGTLVGVRPDWSFGGVGTNPQFTDVEFSTTEYYRDHEIRSNALWVEAKTSAELNALPSPPPNPFTVTADVTVTNDEGRTATGRVIFKTAYVQAEPEPEPEEEAAPPFLGTLNLDAPPGTLVSLDPDWSFGGAGTNPRFTDVEFSTTEYYSYHGILRNRLWVETKTSAELNALPSPPPNPFTVTADVTVTNDEGRTATGRAIFKTAYVGAEPEPESEPEVVPTFSLTENWHQFAGAGTSIYASQLFDNAGTNPRITGVEFSTMAYFRSGYVAHKQLWVSVKSAAELNAMALPPPNGFTVDATVTMENDEGQTASGTITFQVSYARTSTTTTPQPGESEEGGPTLSVTEPLWAPPGKLFRVSASRIFDNAGRRVRFTGAVFSTTEYYSVHEFRGGQLDVQPKTAAELNALASPPPSTFEVTVEVTITNEQGQTASGTLTYQTTYTRVEPAAEPEQEEAPPNSEGGGSS